MLLVVVVVDVGCYATEIIIINFPYLSKCIEKSIFTKCYSTIFQQQKKETFVNTVYTKIII